MSDTRYWNGSSWVLIPDGTKARYWNGSSWVSPNFVKVWNGSSWVTKWSKSDPIIRTYYPSYTCSVRFDGVDANYQGRGTDSDLYIGSFDGGQPYHYVSLMKFGGSVENGTSIGAELSTRPAVSSATLRLTRGSAGMGGGVSDPSDPSYLYTGIWTTDIFPVQTPMASMLGHWDNVPQTSYNVGAGSPGVTWDQTITVSIAAQQVNDIGAGGCELAIAGVWNDVFETYAGSTQNYMKFYGLASGGTLSRPLLTVTYDYI